MLPGSGNRPVLLQSMDVLRMPIDRERLKELEIQFHQLLTEADPVQRGGLFPSLGQAIAHHDAAFDTVD